jgi:glutathione synthase/RimK-type ligase-like ATP-grasp enzyme
MRVGLCTRNARNPVIELLDGVLTAEGHTVDVLTDPRQLASPVHIDVGFWRPDSRDRATAEFSRQVPIVLEGLGVPFVNSLASCDRAFNKLVAGCLFRAAGVPTPAVCLAPQRWEDAGSPPLLPGPVIAKPVEGKASEGIELFPSADSALRRLGDAAESYLLQQPIEWVQIFRLIVNRSGVVRGFVQSSPSGRAEPAIAGVEKAWPPPAEDIPEEAEALGVAMLNAVGGDLMRADILRDGAGKLWALEINSSFGFPHDDAVVLSEFSRQFRLAADRRTEPS